MWAAICAIAIIPSSPFRSLSPRTSFAQSADALKKAQAAFDTAQQDYLQGKYDEAAQGFQDAYAARQFPQFLYNAGAAFHMKGKKQSDVAAYTKAVEFYKRYLTEDPQAADKAKVEKAIAVLETEIKRIAALGVGSGSGSAGSGSGSGSGSAMPPAAPSPEVQQLGDVKVRGLVVIESEPQNATIYLDDKKKGAFATTPWSGSLDGEHKIIIEKKGFKISESSISADPSKLFVLKAVMSEEGYLGWVEFSSNIKGSEIFMDDKTIGSIGKTPFQQNVKPGKHTFYISAEGYSEYKQEIEILPGQTYQIRADISGTPLGKINVQGLGIEEASITVDGQRLCERGPCLKGIPVGEHSITVSRPGFKPYRRRVSIQEKTETQIKVGLAPTPSRSDAIIAYVLAAGFTGGGIYLGLQSDKLKDELTKEIAAGMPPPDKNDPRFTRGKIFAIAADASFALGALTALGAIYYTFREKGAPSTGLIDVRALAIQPQVGPTYAGVGMEAHW
ncbi:MAG: PEGA domain-containing protein [Deltaproteobacteria bacterium]|nr:PEGA domain-containing protein [Deltaproteobacteria bacterium]